MDITIEKPNLEWCVRIFRLSVQYLSFWKVSTSTSLEDASKVVSTEREPQLVSENRLGTFQRSVISLSPSVWGQLDYLHPSVPLAHHQIAFPGILCR